MRNQPPAPADTIELLLSEIAARLRRRASKKAAAVVLAAVLSACGSTVPVEPSRPTTVASAPNERTAAHRSPLDAPCTGDAGVGTPHDCPAAMPACTADGTCAACRTPSHCAVAALACHDGSCGACSNDDECASGRCLVDGTCLALAAVAYVDHGHSCRNEQHDSSPADPYCEIAPALPQGGIAVLRVAPSLVPYEPFTVDETAAIDVTVLGPGPLNARIEAAQGDAVRFAGTHGASARLRVRGFTLVGATGAVSGSAVSCTGKSDHADLHLADVVLSSSGSRGLFGFGCRVELIRSVVRDNGGRGVELWGSTYVLDADFVFDNGGAGVSVSDSTGVLSHLSVVGNHSTHDAGGVVCDGAGELTDSIVVDNTSPTRTGDEAQVDPRCVVTRTSLGTGSLRGLACTPRFVATDDLHLDRSSVEVEALNRACVIDVGLPTLPLFDIDAQPVHGLASDLGADEST